MSRRILLLLLLAVACRDDTARHEEFVGQTQSRAPSTRYRGTIVDVAWAGPAQSRTVKFTLTHAGARVQVVARGTLPVRFAEGSEAAVEGRWVSGTATARVLEEHGFRGEPGELLVATQVLAYGPAH